MSKQYAVIGLGKFGFSVAERTPLRIWNYRRAWHGTSLIKSAVAQRMLIARGQALQ